MIIYCFLIKQNLLSFRFFIQNQHTLFNNNCSKCSVIILCLLSFKIFLQVQNDRSTASEVTEQNLTLGAMLLLRGKIDIILCSPYY